MRLGRPWSLVAGWVSLALVGCASPLQSSEVEQDLRQRVTAAIERELTTLPRDEPMRQTTRPPGAVEAALASRRAELDAIGPQVASPREELNLGLDLTGRPQTQVATSLRSVITSAVRNNLAVQIARLQPAINATDVVAANAAFDAVFFSNVDLTKTDQPSPVPVIESPSGALIPIGVGVNASERYRFETGLRTRLTSGAEVTLSTDLTRFRDLAPGFSLTPDPAYTAALRLGVTQPLLRGFGSNVNRATIRLSRNLERRSTQQLRGELLQLLADTESAYWDLVFAWQNLAVQQWLLTVGIEVRDVLEQRRDFDTRLSHYADAVARVEQRKANVIRGRRTIRVASDALKGFMNDPQLTVGSETILAPADQMVEALIRYNLREAILTAVDRRPEVHQAVLGIDDATIRQTLADNARLPLLNLSAQLAYFGLTDGAGDAYGELFDADFIDYLVGVAFELPIGNRAAEAGVRKARLQRSAAVVGYQQAVQRVVLQVKTALRDVITDYELIQATRSFRVAQAENLRALIVDEETMAGLTPEFLDLKFQRQETLAAAQQQEILALANYNKSIAALYRAMGVSLTMNGIELEVMDGLRTPGEQIPVGTDDASSRPSH